MRTVMLAVVLEATSGGGFRTYAYLIPVRFWSVDVKSYGVHDSQSNMKNLSRPE